MARTPDPADAGKIRVTLRFYRVLAYVTGIFLLLLCAEIVLKYVFGYELELNGANGFLALAPWAPDLPEQMTGTNLSTLVQITHGYVYLTYLVVSYLLVNWMRWPIMRFVLIALGGVVPLLSFFVEHRETKRVKAVLAQMDAQREAVAAAAAAPSSESGTGAE